ncbi:hypothetical protein [Pseudobdellovibrio exovorus]|uniref:Uncharacterized protein n=1 Tax=Pseudobdellovibrio exovorus JSS TaxID=1184267 RepID=M4V974_9BACT|nr:hypothetical protein [Pseudobdellovibrio exovorus]AGH94566.1 hypothetical protein A11Q_346 [Pseudobdellovibrio exovorus JSS]
MKKVGWLIGLGLIIITVCMGYLIKQGISLRSAPLIQPSVMDADRANVATSVIQRMHQNFEDVDYAIFGVAEKAEDQQLIRMMAEEYEKVFKAPVQFLVQNDSVTADVVAACTRPCWILTGFEKAHTLAGVNTWMQDNLISQQKPFLSLTIVDFQVGEPGDDVVSDECHQQKRLSFDCLVPVSVREIKRRMKKPDQKYFFLRQYNGEDFFLFLQK